MAQQYLLAEATVRAVDGKHTTHNLIVDYANLRDDPKGLDVDPAFNALVEAQRKMKEGTGAFTMIEPMATYNVANVSAITYKYGSSPEEEEVRRALGFALPS